MTMTVGCDALLMTGPHAGNVYPVLPVVAELTHRRHRLTHVTITEFAHLASAVGASVLNYGTSIAELDPAEVFAANDDGALPHMLYLQENLQILRAAEAAFDGSPPDVVLYEDFAFIAGRLLAYRWNRPAVRLSVGFATNHAYSFYQDMIDASGIPGPLTLERFRTAFANLLGARDVHCSPEDFWYRVEDLNLVFIPRAFQFAGDTFDERFMFIGPCLEGRRDDHWTPPDDRPVVLVSLGTSFNDHPEFFRDCVDAFAEGRWHVVMTLGSRVDPIELGPLPANIEAHNWISHFAVLERAQICVTHGGMGTVMQSLHWGRPLVAIPEHAFDVVPMARRIVELGLGRRIDSDRLDAECLHHTIEEVADDAAILTRVKDMQRDIRCAGGAPRAADAVLAQLSSRRQGAV
ncbi:macrolide family glycosyltransferase [Mycobacterium sp.]|uniref:macrolide family glycosyltransferase n=1 Tax=Mycobacterium sp. TaxID=1785 RepID=UPI002C89A2F2|nr:macrolide family glycosyltransferase [Mycobacterium sp.]HTY35338.1 macrolide family glycosyltransferase [Mycobacterium sp.]